MPARRSSTRIASSSTPKKVKSAKAPEPKAAGRTHKRALSSDSAAQPSKRAKAGGASSSKTTPKKSQYFESADTPEDITDPPTSENEEEESGYEEVDSTSPTQSPASDDSDVSESSFDDRKKRRKAKSNKSSDTTPKGLIASTIEKGKELWREGVKTGLGAGKAVFIERPKPRGDGGIRYKDDKIHPNTFAFLADLKNNNDREWFKMHDPDYRDSKNDWDTFVACLTSVLMEKDDTIPELPPKDLTFRIYRDVRFSKDPSPYKPHFSAAWSRTGRKGPYAAYYCQISPDNSFVGCGLWQPEPSALALLRANVDGQPGRIKRVLMDPLIRKEILGGVKADEKKAVQEFCRQNAESALKTKPKDYDATHPDIDLLRLRNYTIGRKLKQDEVIGKGLERIAGLMGAMTPFVQFLNSIVMPDDDDDQATNPSNDASEDDAQDSPSL